MNPLKKSIIHYVSTITNGLVTLTDRNADHIIYLVNGNILPPSDSAKVLRFSYSNNLYTEMFTIPLTRDQLDKLLKYSLENKPIEKFYRYDLCENGDFVGYIYTITPFLHDQLI